MNWKEFTMKYGGGLTKYQKRGEVQSSSLKPEQMNFKYKTAHGYKFPEYNAALIPKGTEAVQKYQKMLNETYGTFLAEDGAWGPETQKAYERFIVNKETPQPFEKTKYRPYLGEFKKMYERMPSYNYGYESLRDADPTTMGVQQGPLTQERTQQIQGLPSEQELRQSYLGKTFGGLPMFQGSDIYEGYSPNRTWLDKDPYTGYQNPREVVEKLATNPRYAYILTPKPGTTLEQNINNPVNYKDYFEFEDNDLVKIKDPQGFKNLINYVITDPKFLNTDIPYQEVTDKFKNFEEKDWSDPKKISEILYPEGDKESANFFRRNVLNSKNLKIPYTPIYWREGDAMASDFSKNPEIAQYMKEKGITLAGGYRHAAKNNLPKSTAFTSQLGESVLAQRDAAINKRPFGFAGSGWGSPVIQDPNMFNLSGYIPITEDMFYVDPRGTMQSYWDDPAKRKEYLLKAGVPEDQLDKVYINTSTFPIQEYKPRKDAQGNIYQYGGGLPIYQKKGEFNWKTYKDVGIQPLPSKSQIAAAQGQQRENTYVKPVVKNAAQLQRINQIQEEERQRRIQETADRVRGTLRATTDADIEAQNREDYTLTGRARSLGRGDFNPLVVAASAADLINPASYWYAGKDFGRGVKQTGEGIVNLDPEQIGSGLLQTGLSALQLYPGASTARSVIKGAAPRLFGSTMSSQANDFLRSVRSMDDFATGSPSVYRTQPGLSSGPISSTPAISRVGSTSGQAFIPSAKQTGKYSPSIVSDLSSFFAPFNPKNLQTNSGLEWMKQWYSDPDIIRRTEGNFPKGFSKFSIIMDSDNIGSKALKHFKNKLNAYEPKNYIDLLKDRGLKKYLQASMGSKGLSAGYPSGIYVNRTAAFPFDKRGLESTRVHELTHLIEHNGAIFNDDNIKSLLKPFGYSSLSEVPENKTLSFIDREIRGINPEYYLEPSEIHARMNQGRFNFNLTPKDQFTTKMFDEISKKYDWYGMGRYIKDKDAFIDLMNNFWAIPATVGIGAGAYQQFNQKPQGTYQYGGPTIDLKLPQFEEDKPRPFFEITGAGTVPQYDVFGYGYVPLGKNLGISADLMSFKEGDWRGGRYGISGNINIPINRGERRTRPDVKDLPIYQKRGEVSYSSVVDPKTKRINLEAFDRLQSLLKEQELIAQSRPEGAKTLPEIQIVGERPGLGSRIRNAIKPYVAPEGGFLDQWRQRIVDETGGADWYKQPNSVLGAFSSVVTSPLQAPQYAAVYAATDGKLQTPSEALNIQNPVGSFLTDVALDPMTYVGLGVSKIPQKIGQAAIPSIEQAGKYLTTQTPLRNTYKINPLATQISDAGSKVVNASRPFIYDLEKPLFERTYKPDPNWLMGYRPIKDKASLDFSPFINTVATEKEAAILEKFKPLVGGTPETIDLQQFIDRYAAKQNKKRLAYEFGDIVDQAYKEKLGRNYDYNDVKEARLKYEEPFNERVKSKISQYDDSPLGRRLGAGAEGEVYELAGYPDRVIKFGRTFKTDNVEDLVNSSKAFANRGNIATIERAFQKGYDESGNSYLASIMPNLNAPGREFSNLSKQQVLAKLEKDVNDLMDKGFSLDVRNIDANFAYNPKTNVVDIYDLSKPIKPLSEGSRREIIAKLRDKFSQPGVIPDDVSPLQKQIYLNQNIVDNVPMIDKVAMMAEPGDLVRRASNKSGIQFKDGRMFKLNSGTGKQSIHFTGSGAPVESHHMGNWDYAGTSYVLPYADFGSLNGMPRSTALGDVYWWNPRQFEFPKTTKVLTSDMELAANMRNSGFNAEFSKESYKIQRQLKDLIGKYGREEAQLTPEWQKLLQENARIHNDWIRAQNPQPINNASKNVNLGSLESRHFGDVDNPRSARSTSSTPYIHSETPEYTTGWKGNPNARNKIDAASDIELSTRYNNELSENFKTWDDYDKNRYWDDYSMQDEFRLSHVDRIQAVQKLTSASKPLLTEYLKSLKNLPARNKLQQFELNTLEEFLKTGKIKYKYQIGGESNIFNWSNLDQWFKNGGESDFVNNIYSDYMDGVYDGTPLEENAKKVYDKLNTIYYTQAKESGMTPPNYIMTNVIKKALKPS